MPKQMTDADELAILREVQLAHFTTYRGKYEVWLKDIFVLFSNGAFEAYRTATGTNGGEICNGETITEAIFLARQRLAEEREAKKSPRERRLEQILQTLVRDRKNTWSGMSGHIVNTPVAEIEAALKED